MVLDDEDKAALKALQGVFDMLLQLRATMTLQQVILLLSVANDEGRSQAHHANLLGYDKGIVSRNFHELGNRSRRFEGMQLVEARDAPDNLREKLVSLTPKGRAMVKKMARKVQGAKL